MLDWLLGHMSKVSTSVLGQVDALVPAVPGRVSGLCGELGTVTGWVAPVTAWVPWGALGFAIGLWLLGVGVAFAIKVVRIGASFLTLGGGSAA